MIFPDWLRVNEKNNLEGEGCDLVKVAGEFGTPLYVYSETEIRRRCRDYRKAMNEYYGNGEVIYAGKSFLVLALCRLMAEEGLGLDVVSGGELFTAVTAGYPAECIYFHGNNKTPAELSMAIAEGVGRIVVDSLSELEMLGLVSAAKGKTADILLRLKPGIEAHTHDYIKTGQNDAKFGLGIEDGQAWEAVRKALELPGINLKGVHCHIGSQIFDVQEPFRLAAQVMVEFMSEVRRKTGVVMEELNLGGGLGIRYTSDDKPVAVNVFVRHVSEAVKDACERNNYPRPRLMIEPGRSIVGEAGLTLYTVGTVKDIPDLRTYVSVDGGMMDNLRVALYGAKYDAVLANRAADEPDSVVTLAGKACESGDILIRDLRIPRPKIGDIVAVFSTGAYHFSMYSSYNRNPRPAVVFMQNGRADVVVKRETYKDMIRAEIIPEHLQTGTGINK